MMGKSPNKIGSLPIINSTMYRIRFARKIAFAACRGASSLIIFYGGKNDEYHMDNPFNVTVK